MAYTPLRSGESEYNSTTQILPSEVPAGATGSKSGDYFARMVYVVNSSGSSGSSGGSTSSGGTLTGDITPSTGNALTITSSVTSLSSAITLAANTILVRIAFIGAGDCMITYNGDTPSTSVGEPRYPGGVLELSRSIADQLKLIRSGSSDCNIYVTQFSS